MSEKIEQMEKRIANLELTVGNLENDIKVLEADNEDMQSQLSQSEMLEAAVAELQDELKAIHPKVLLVHNIYPRLTQNKQRRYAMTDDAWTKAMRIPHPRDKKKSFNPHTGMVE